jgi:hypothetical protein
MSGGVCEPCHGNGSTEHRPGNVRHLFHVKLGDIATTTQGKLQQAFGDNAMSRAQTFRWHKQFSEGKNFIEVEQRSGRPSATWTGDNTARVRELGLSDRKLRVKMIADEVNMNWETVRLISTEEMGVIKICAKIMPRNLTEQKWDAQLSAVFKIQMHYGDAAASLIT